MKKVIVDTSVWIDHLKNTNNNLVKLIEMHLGNELVILAHEMVIGELLLGGFCNNSQLYSLIRNLARAPIANIKEFETFVTANSLQRWAIGFVDAHILISCKLASASVLTLDKSLDLAAKELGINT